MCVTISLLLREKGKETCREGKREGRRGQEVGAWCGVTCCARIIAIFVSLPTSHRGKEGRKGHVEGERDKGSERAGGGSTVWRDVLCANHRRHRVIAIKLSRWQEGRGGEEMVMDASARERAVTAWCGMSCHVHIIIVIVSFPSMSLPSRAQEGGREGRGGR